MSTTFEAGRAPLVESLAAHGGGEARLAFVLGSGLGAFA